MNEVKEYFKKWGSVCRMYKQGKPIHCHDTLLLFAQNYHEEQVKKLTIPVVVGQSEQLPDEDLYQPCKGCTTSCKNWEVFFCKKLVG